VRTPSLITAYHGINSPLNMSSQTLSKAQRMSYRIGRGEQGVLTFEPYKSEILPLWRFKTPAIAQKSSKQIYDKFKVYEERDDFVGMDMCRKFLQMVPTFVTPPRACANKLRRV
jgi:hypothetical protein